MTTVTVDTSIFPSDDLRAALEPKDFSFAAVTVTERELTGHHLAVELQQLSSVPGVAVWGESTWRTGLWGGPSVGGCFEDLLRVIGNGSFPPSGKRDNLTAGERRQLRDAMIFCGHVHAGLDIFLTNDAKAFVNGGRRAKLEAAYKTRIMTRDEFVTAFILKPA
jgi:hypothetical protein